MKSLQLVWYQESASVDKNTHHQPFDDICFGCFRVSPKGLEYDASTGYRFV
jgi:hypothetical protein